MGTKTSSQSRHREDANSRPTGQQCARTYRWRFHVAPVNGKFRRSTRLETLLDFHLQDVIEFELRMLLSLLVARSELRPAPPTTRFLFRVP